MSPRVCYPSLITGPTLGCGDCQSSNPNTFHLGTSIEFGDLDHLGPGRPERQAPSVKIILGQSAFRSTGLRVRPSQSSIDQNVRDGRPKRRAPSQSLGNQKVAKIPELRDTLSEIIYKIKEATRRAKNELSCY